MSDSYTLSRVIQATPKRLFESWLDSREHSSITGRAATDDSVIRMINKELRNAGNDQKCEADILDRE